MVGGWGGGVGELMSSFFISGPRRELSTASKCFSAYPLLTSWFAAPAKSQISPSVFSNFSKSSTFFLTEDFALFISTL